MTPLHEVIINKNTKINPIWIMRQAGRYLPEFREIRKLNPNFINLCLNENLSSEITLQPLKRFNLDAAIIFSDILMLPYGLNQKVEFEKGFGPKLGEVNIDEMSRLDEVDFIQKVYPVYKAIKKVSTDDIVKGKNTIGFVGAPWTLLVYIINQQSPKKKLKEDFFKNDFLINRILLILEKFLKIHIKNQIDNGANVIQIFDSWAGLLEEKDLPNYIYSPTLNLVNYVKSLNILLFVFLEKLKIIKNFVKLLNQMLLVSITILIQKKF
jgi:uroporphyrinogen decarboxylase